MEHTTENKGNQRAAAPPVADEIAAIMSALHGGGLLHTSAIAEIIGKDTAATGAVLTRLYREGKVVRYHPRKSNVLHEKLWRNL